MIEQIGKSITFDAFYEDTDGAGVTGLTVTVDVYNPAGTEVVTGGSATEVGDGLYTYTLGSGSVLTAGRYRAVFKTASASVVAQHRPSAWTVGATWVENLDDAITDIAGLVWSYLKAAVAALGTTTIGRFIYDKLNLISSSSITVSSPTLPDSTALVIQGDDYGTAQALQWSSDGWTDLTGLTLDYAIVNQYNAAETYTGNATVVTAGSGTQTIALPLAAAVTAQLAAGGEYYLQIRANVSSEDVTLINTTLNSQYSAIQATL